MLKFLRDTFRGFGSWRTWLGQVAWWLVLTGLARVGLWLLGLPLTTVREIGFWLVVPAMIGVSLHLLRGRIELDCWIPRMGVHPLPAPWPPLLILQVVVANRGDRPSAATGWEAQLQFAGSEKVHTVRQTQVESHGPGLFRYVDHDREVEVETKDLIWNKTFSAIQPGDMKSGYFTGSLPQGIDPAAVLRAGTRVSLVFFGIDERRREAVLVSHGQLETRAGGMPGVPQPRPLPPTPPPVGPEIGEPPSGKPAE